MFKLSIPQPDMLPKDYLDFIIKEMQKPDASRVGMRAISESIRERMNPHPAGQKEENVPHLNGEAVAGIQHKYRETALFFPSEVSSVSIRRDAAVLVLCKPAASQTVLTFGAHP